MSDVNLDFTVSNNSISFTVEPNDITFTPTDFQLNFFAAGASYAGGANSTVQFNAGGLLGGSLDFTYDGPNATVNMNNANIGNLNVLTIANLGSVSNVRISGGSNGLFLRTDGAGNLSWAGGNLSVGGTNTSIQFNDSASFNGSSNFTFDKLTNVVNLNGNISANYFIGNGSALTSLTGANVTGTVANASYSTTAANINAATYAIENVALIGAQTGVYDVDFLNKVIKYSTGTATANLVLNFRANSSVTANSFIANGQSVTSTYVMTTGSNVYYVTGVQIDGSVQTIKWAAGASPLPAASSKNSYTFTIIKTSTTPTYDVLGSFARYS